MYGKLRRKYSAGLFKSVWNGTYISFASKYLKKIMSTNNSIRNRFVMSLTNFILAPCIATIAVNQSCFYYAFTKADNVILIFFDMVADGEGWISGLVTTLVVMLVLPAVVLGIHYRLYLSKFVSISTSKCPKLSFPSLSRLGSRNGKENEADTNTKAEQAFGIDGIHQNTSNPMISMEMSSLSFIEANEDSRIVNVTSDEAEVTAKA